MARSQVYSHTSESKICVGKEDGKTERHKIAARRRKGRVNAYINFSIRASPNISKAIVAVCSKTGECRTTDIRTSPKMS